MLENVNVRRTPLADYAGKRIVLGSIVRDGMGYLDRYISQVQRLAYDLDLVGAKLNHVVVEGDSSDGSWERLIGYHVSTQGNSWSVRLLKFDHGGTAYGSVDKPERWKNIARTWNHLFQAIEHELIDAFVYVEADLFWDPSTITGLLDHVFDGVDAVAPMSMLSDSIFWDTWGHRAGGLRFQNQPPFHPWLDPRKKIPPDCYDRERGLIRIDSAGSCGVFRGEVVRRCRFSELDAMIGHSLYRSGFSFWLDPMLAVRHPNIYGGEQ